MTLEQELASIFESIEKAKNAGNSTVLAALLQRKDAICAVLVALEQSWHEPQAQAPKSVRGQWESGEKVLVPLLVNSCV